MRRVKALILGGGQGKRLFPLTRDRSKPAVPIAGKYRLIDISLSNCINSNIRNIFVLTQFNSASLNHHINHTYRFDYFTQTFVEILAAEQTIQNREWFQGTADAVKKNINHLNLEDNDDVLILSGDHLYKMDYHEIIAFHREKNADFTVSTVIIPAHIIEEFGIIKLDKQMRLSEFKEKPSRKEMPKSMSLCGEWKEKFNLDKDKDFYLASMGVYVFKADVLKKILAYTSAVDFGMQVIPEAIKRYKAYGFIFDGYWRDIGTIKSFYEENIALTEVNPKFDFFSEERKVFTHPRFLPPAKIIDSQIVNSLITEGCLIQGAHIEKSVIGLRSVINKKVTLKESIVMGADYYERESSRGIIPLGIGEGSVLERVIVDKNARIGKRVVIKNLEGIKHFDSENYYIRDGIVIIPKNALIPDSTQI
ncbi:MAG: glucose-1-phosphate adenylyltransferase [Candidatus Omnitrophica bacterium]|nr:glucose-1-phosphate adenylyltransferase [Candidatus Omnitrophota bacterium]